MRPGLILAFAVPMILAASVAGQPPGLAWEVTLGGSGADDAFDILEAGDGGFLVVGCTESYGAGSGDIWLLKLSSDGHFEWDCTYGDTGYEWGQCVIETQDGGYAILGGAAASGGGAFDIWLLKVDGTGELLWDATFGGVYDEYPAGLVETPEGDFILVGTTFSYGAGSTDILLYRVDSNGSKILMTTYGDQYINMVRDITACEDGSCTVLGTRTPYGSNTDMWLFNVDSTGEQVWETTYGTWFNDNPRALCMYPSEGYLVAGSTPGYGVDSSDVWLIRLDASGGVTWDSAYGGPFDDIATVCCITPEGDWLAGGYTFSLADYSFDYYLIEVDSSGVLEWELVYGSPEYNQEIWALSMTSDGGCIVAGYTQTDQIWNTDVLVIRTYPLPQYPQEPPENFAFRMYPNPLLSPSPLHLEFQMPWNGTASIGLYDIMGRLVASSPDYILRPGVQTVDWFPGADGESLPVGVYFLEVSIAGMKLTEELVILR